MKRLVEKTVAHLLRRHPTSAVRVVALRREGVRLSETELEVEGRRFQVREGRSNLEIRRVLQEAERSGSDILLLSDLATSDIDLDVGIRLLGGSVATPDPWGRLADTLGIRTEAIDTLLRRGPAADSLASSLLAALPEQGSPRLAEGRLSVSRAWKLAQEYVLGLGGSDLTPDGLIEQDRRGALARWRAAPEVLRQGFLTHLENHHLQGVADGALCATLLRQVVQGGEGRLLALGLSIDVLHASGEPSVDRIRCQGRFEAQFQMRPAPELLRRWSEAAVDVFSRQDPALRAQLAHQAQALLVELGVSDDFRLSSVLPEGFRQRLDDFATALMREPGSLVTLASLLGHIRTHRHAELERERVERAELALRMARWLSAPSALPQTLDDAVEDYLQDVGWLDRARDILLQGDASPVFQDACRTLQDAIRDHREAWNKRFGQLLSQGRAEVPSVAMAIEDVLDRVVVPLAQVGQNPLLLVMDGMGCGDALEILDDLRADWIPHVPESTDADRALSPVGSSVPTVTEFARTSLLCGCRTRGGQAEERRGFARRFPEGKLFHKDALSSQRSDGIAPEVRSAIAEGREVVAVVVNAIDDQLSGSEQIRTRWKRSTIQLLADLLEAARAGNRVVVLASDHGHVLERGSQLASGTSQGGERWCAPERALLDGEIVVDGTRLDAWTGSVIAPWSETLRYVAVHAGYHGGVTAQEWIAPLCVLAPTGKPLELAGWKMAESVPPTWWLLDADLSPEGPARKLDVPARSSPAPGLPLFQPIEVTSTASWIDSVLGSDVFEAQCRIGVRSSAGKSKADMVRAALQAFDLDGDLEEIRLPRQVVAHKVGEPLMRLAGWIAQVSRLLNVDSAEIFGTTPDGQFLFLRRKLLLRQFGIGGNP